MGYRIVLPQRIFVPGFLNCRLLMLKIGSKYLSHCYYLYIFSNPLAMKPSWLFSRINLLWIDLCRVSTKRVQKRPSPMSKSIGADTENLGSAI
jgi:hypothetical protein